MGITRQLAISPTAGAIQCLINCSRLMLLRILFPWILVINGKNKRVKGNYKFEIKDIVRAYYFPSCLLPS
jgi:hypothetical protein